MEAYMDAGNPWAAGTFYPTVTLQVWTYTQDLKTSRQSAQLSSVQFSSAQMPRDDGSPYCPKLSFLNDNIG